MERVPPTNLWWRCEDAPDSAGSPMFVFHYSWGHLYSCRMRPQRNNERSELKTLFSPWPAFPIGVAVCLLGSFLYVWFRIEPLLEYHNFGPFFFRNRAFLESFLNRPGGLAHYAGVFLAQLNGVNLLGALLFALVQGVVLLQTLFCLRWVSGRTPGFYALPPVFALLLLRNGYGSPWLALSIGLVLALTAFGAFLRLRRTSACSSTLASGLLSAALFFLAGIWSALLFSVLCGLEERLHRHASRAWASVGLAFLAPVLTLIAGKVEFTTLPRPWMEGVPWVLAAALYGSIPLTAAVLGTVPKAGANPVPDAEPCPREGAAAALSLDRWSGSTCLWLRLAVFLACWAAVWFTFDGRQKVLAEIDYYASTGQYEAVLSSARQAQALSHPAKVRLQWALYHTGRLAEDLFAFLNWIDDAPDDEIGEDWRAQTLPLLDLGLLNDAEHMAHEALEIEGDRPDLLRLLARINLLKDRPQAAQVFLNVLSLIPFQHERANDAWPKVDVRTLAAEHDALGHLSAPPMVPDAPHESVAPMIEVLLAANSGNQMAFEYLMAHYLIDLDLKQAIEHLALLDNFHYAAIPRPYEEAVLLYQQLAGVQVEVKGRAIRPQTIERFRQFREAVRQAQGRAEGFAAIAATFGDTYWCYYYANRSKRAPQSQSSGL